MRKSISTAFFSMVSTLMVLGIVLMGCSEWVLFKNYFAKDRYETLDQVVNVAKRTAEYLVNSETMPQGAELDALNTKLEIIGESAEAYLFFTDRQGNVLIASDPDKLTTTTVPLDICQRANAVADPDARHYHAFGDLGGALTEKSYIAAVETIDDQSLFSGWLFLCSSGAQLTDFKQQFWSNFLMSASVMLLCAVPRVLRALVAVIGWAYTVLVGLSVIAAQWHRPTDVIMALLIVGGLALLALATTFASGMDEPGTRVSSASVQIVGSVMLTIGVLGILYGAYIIWQIQPGLAMSAEWTNAGAYVSTALLTAAVSALVLGITLAMRQLTASPLTKLGLVGAPPAPPKR